MNIGDFATLCPDQYANVIKYIDTYDYVSLMCTNRQLKLTLPQTWHSSQTIGNSVLSKVLLERKNVFLTGPGGCGKTHTVRRLAFHAKRLGLELAVVSTTGISATYIEGITLHSYFGIRTYKHYDEFAKNKRLYRSTTVTKKLTNLDILVIDEVSMLGKKTLELIERIAREYRGNENPFGGLCVVFSGDFHQLPPVLDKMTFTSEIWTKLKLHTTTYNVSVRHKDDYTYFSLLNRIRTGQHNLADIKWLRLRENLSCSAYLTIPIHLYSTNKEALEHNMKEYNKLTGPEFINYAEDIIEEKVADGPIFHYVPSGDISVNEATKLLEKVLIKVPKNLGLKVGAQYYLTVNLDVKKGLVNGTSCVLVSVNGNTVKIKYKGGDRHSPDLWAHAEVAKMSRKFLIRDNYYLKRTQLPLKLGYAMTIHYSQGATLDKAVVDVSRTFTCAQVYVALSRVRELEDLYLINFDPKKIRASKSVLEYYKQQLNWNI